MSGDASDTEPFDLEAVSAEIQENYYRVAIEGREDKLTKPATLGRVIREVAAGLAVFFANQRKEDDETIASLNRVHYRLKAVEALVGKAAPEIDIEHDGERSFVIRIVVGETKSVSSFTLPVPLYRGVWREAPFAKGDMCTFAGSVWYATADTVERPGSGGAWVLCCKRGRDGRDAGAAA